MHTQTSTSQLYETRRHLYTTIMVQIFVIFILTIIAYNPKNTQNKQNFQIEFKDFNQNLPKFLHIFILPINLICIICVTFHRLWSMAIYLPFRYLFLYLMFGSATKVPLVYGPILVIEIVIQIFLHLFAIKLVQVKREKARGQIGNDQNNSIFSTNISSPKIIVPKADPPSYVEVSTNPAKYPILQF